MEWDVVEKDWRQPDAFQVEFYTPGKQWKALETDKRLALYAVLIGTI
jgi:hypothetical protein